MKIEDPAKGLIFESAITKAGLKTEHETNNESGHAFWEEDEYIIIRKVELHP